MTLTAQVVDDSRYEEVVTLNINLQGNEDVPANKAPTCKAEVVTQPELVKLDVAGPKQAPVPTSSLKDKIERYENPTLLSRAPFSPTSLSGMGDASPRSPKEDGERGDRPTRTLRFSSPESPKTVDTEGRPKLNKVRKFTHLITRRFSSYRRQSTLFTSSKRVPSLSVPTSPPISSHHLPNATVDMIRCAITRTRQCPLIQILEEAGCYNLVVTPWEPCPSLVGTEVRKCCYSVAVPTDIPSIAKRMLNLPDDISCTSVWRLRRLAENQIVLVQHSYSKDILYGDRFKVQSIVTFTEENDIGGVTMQQWVEVLWDKPLPWTHTVLVRLIESRAYSDTVGYGPELARLVTKSLHLQGLQGQEVLSPFGSPVSQ